MLEPMSGIYGISLKVDMEKGSMMEQEHALQKHELVGKYAFNVHV